MSMPAVAVTPQHAAISKDFASGPTATAPHRTGIGSLYRASISVPHFSQLKERNN